MRDSDVADQWYRQAPDGTPGLTALFHLLARFLSPTFSESGGIFVGELIMHLFRKAGDRIGGVLPDLLRAVVGRLISAKLPSFIQVSHDFVFYFFLFLLRESQMC